VAEEITIPGLPNVQQLIRYAKVLGAWQLGLYPPNILWFMDSSRVSVGFTEVPSIKVDRAIMFELPIARKSDADKVDRIEIKGKKAYFVIGGKTIDVEVEESTFDLSPLLEMPKKRHEFGWLDLRDGKDVLSEMRLMKFSDFGDTVAIDFYNGVFAVTDYDDIPESKDVIERLVKRGQFYDLWKATFELQDFYVNVSVPSLSAIRSSYLDDIVKELKNPLLIYMSPVVDLFGPIVFLTARKDSDYDVYVIVAPVVLGEPIEEYYKRYHELPKNVRDFLSIYPDLAEKVEEDWKKLEKRVEELWREAEELKKKYEEAEKHLRKPGIKEYYDWLEKVGRLEWVQEAIRRAKEVYPDVVTDLLMWELIYRALDRETTKEDLVRYAEEWAERVKEETEKKKVVEEKPPTPPKPPEKPFFGLAKKLAIEKLTLFTKAKALELGFSIEEANRIVQDLKDELTLLGTAIVTGDTTQEAAEREIEEGLRNLKRKKEEEERRREEARRVRMSKREALTRIRRDVEITLRDQGYTGISKALSYIRPELEILAEEVAEGRMSVEEAIRRATELARTYATPPKPPKAPPTVPRVERPPVEVLRRPEKFLSAEEAADIIWKEYLGELFNFGIRYVFENYLRERGMLEQDLGRVAYRLASKVRLLGQRMRREGEEEGVGRYIWASYALTRYAPEIVQFGLLWAMRKIVPEIWPELRLFRNVVEALRRTGIEGCTAKALVGVVYDYVGIPRAKWPEDVIKCYEAFVEAAERPPEVGRRSLWELFE